MGRKIMQSLGAFGLGLAGGASSAYYDYARDRRRDIAAGKATEPPSFSEFWKQSPVGKAFEPKPAADPVATTTSTPAAEPTPPPVETAKVETEDSVPFSTHFENA